MPYLWNASTTIRNSSRLSNFLETALQIEGSPWNEDTQIRYQVLLIQNRFYNPNKYHEFMNNQVLTYDQALEIFNHQNYVDPPMRGRTSLSPLRKLGFVDILNGLVTITPLGFNFINNPNSSLTNAMVEWTFTLNGANIRPFIILLKFLQTLETQYNITSITYKEFGYFIMTINNINEIDNNINLLIQYRQNNIINYNSNDIINFNNLSDYIDNNVRYLSQSDLLILSNDTISLNHNNIDLINSLLNTYNGTATQNLY